MRILSGEGMRAGQPSANQRLLALGAELIKITPQNGTNIRNLVVGDEIQSMSRRNLNRLLDEIPEPYSLRVSSQEKTQIEEWAASLSFLGIAPFSPEMVGPIQPTNDFYSSLVGGSRTVGLSVFATAQPDNIHSMQGLLYGDSIRANQDFIRRFGIVVPAFTNSLQVLHFFGQRQPQLVQDVIKINRYNLPTNIKTTGQFTQYLNPARMYQVLPDHALAHRLAPMRENMSNFLMTVPDAEVFFRHVLLVYMQTAIDKGLRSLSEFQRIWRVQGGPGYLFREAFEAMGWTNGASIRVPLNLSQYSILRYDEIRPPDPRREFRKDTRRLDHKQMP